MPENNNMHKVDFDTAPIGPEHGSGLHAHIDIQDGPDIRDPLERARALGRTIRETGVWQWPEIDVRVITIDGDAMIPRPSLAQWVVLNQQLGLLADNRTTAHEPDIREKPDGLEFFETDGSLLADGSDPRHFLRPRIFNDAANSRKKTTKNLHTDRMMMPDVNPITFLAARAPGDSITNGDYRSVELIDSTGVSAALQDDEDVIEALRELDPDLTLEDIRIGYNANRIHKETLAERAVYAGATFKFADSFHPLFAHATEATHTGPRGFMYTDHMRVASNLDEYPDGIEAVDLIVAKADQSMVEGDAPRFVYEYQTTSGMLLFFNKLFRHRSLYAPPGKTEVVTGHIYHQEYPPRVPDKVDLCAMEQLWVDHGIKAKNFKGRFVSPVSTKLE